MKLYVWHELDALADYRPGLAFAHADTKRHAIKAILVSMIDDMNAGLKKWPDSADWMRRDATSTMKEMSKELRKVEPQVVECTEVFGQEVQGSA